MCEEFKVCFKTLESLSNEGLDRAVAELVLVENQNVALVIAQLSEISRRKVELERGYRSLFDYGVRRLGLSEGSVALRIQVANIVRRFPQVLDHLADSRISLTVAGRLAPHLREGNVETLLTDCAGMTRRAVEVYLVRLSPEPIFDASIRKRPGEQEKAKAEPSTQSSSRPSPRPSSSPPPTPAAGFLAPATPETYNFRFAASVELKVKLERLAEVLGIVNPVKSMAEVIEHALDLALEQKDPKARLERRRAREREQDRQREAAAPQILIPTKPCPDKVDVSEATAPCAETPRASGAASQPAASRHVPVAMRDRVLERAGYQCQFAGPDGTRCTARTGLEIEHTIPFALRPGHDEPTLEILCPKHNLLRAEQAFGAEYVQHKIEKRRLEALRG